MRADQKQDRNARLQFQLQILVRSVCLCTDCQPVFTVLRLMLHFLYAAEAFVIRKRAEASAVPGNYREVVGPQSSDVQPLIGLNIWQTCSCKGAAQYGCFMPDQDQEDFTT